MRKVLIVLLLTLAGTSVSACRGGCTACGR